MDFCCLLQKPNLDFVRMAIVLLGFYTIHAFAFGMRFGNENHAKNPSKTRPEPFKNRCRKHVDFQHRFSEVLASIWEGLGPPRWSQVRYFAPPQTSEQLFFYPLKLKVFKKWRLGGLRARFRRPPGSIFEGPGTNFSRFWASWQGHCGN